MMLNGPKNWVATGLSQDPLTGDLISTGALAYSCTSTLDRSMGASDASEANPSVSATLASLSLLDKWLVAAAA